MNGTRSARLVLALVLTPTLLWSACGGAQSSTSLAISHQWLLDAGLSSLLIETYAGDDLAGLPIDCDRLAAQYDATSEFQPIGAPVVIPLGGEGSLSTEIGALPPGLTFFLVVGYSSADATGKAKAVGCGETVIERGKKVEATIAMRSL